LVGEKPHPVVGKGKEIKGIAKQKGVRVRMVKRKADRLGEEVKKKMDIAARLGGGQGG